MTDPRPTIWLDPSWRRMDELFSPADRAELDATYRVIWGQDDPAPDAARVAALPEVMAFISSEPAIDADLLAAAPALKAVIEVSGAFPATIDYTACGDRGIEVLSCAPGFQQSVAEMSVAMLLASGRGLVEEHERFRRGEERWLSDNIGEGFTIYGAEIGFVGYGSIAREIARLLAPFGVRVLAYDPYPRETPGVEFVSFEEVLSRPRAVFVTAAPTRENKGMIGREALAVMRPGAHLHLISRAHLADFEALEAALSEGRIRATIDVFPTEPYEVHGRLRSLPGVILSPHRAAAVEGGRHLIGRMILDDLAAICAGQRPARLTRAANVPIDIVTGVGDADKVGALMKGDG